MKKVLILLAVCLTFTMIANAQNSLKDNLSKHVNYLASDEMRGRSAGSEETKLAGEYIKKELAKIGLQVVDLPIIKDSLNKYDSDNDYFEEEIAVEENSSTKENEESLVYNDFYAIIPAENSAFNDKYMVLSADYNGLGIKTIKHCTIILNSANNGASQTAALLELAKYFKQNQNLLKKNLIILFNEKAITQYVCKYLNENLFNNNIEMLVDMYNLGWLNGDEDSWQYTYSTTQQIKNASKILQPILLKNVNFPTYASYNDYYSVPTLEIRGDIINVYDDVVDSLNFDMMGKIVEQSKEVILAFNQNKLEIDTTAKSTNDDIFDILTTENKSYFGLNFMIGSNKHYYTKGNMTGKSAMSYSAGLFYKWQFAKSRALKLDVNYERAYANRNDGRFKSDVLSIPLSVLNSAGFRNFEVYYGLGAYYDYTLSAKLNKQKIDWDDFNKGEFGWLFCVGMRFGHFTMGYYQKMGISNIMSDNSPINGKIKNRNQYFTIGWSF